AEPCYGEIIILPSLHKAHQLLPILSTPRWMHHKHLRRSRSDDDWLEISHRIVGKLRIETGVDPHCWTSDHQRVAIRWRPRRHSRTDIAASAGTGLNKKLLPKLFG